MTTLTSIDDTLCGYCGQWHEEDYDCEPAADPSADTF